MDTFLERLLSTNPDIKDTTKVVNFYERQYKNLEGVPIDALIADIYNHVDIPKPKNFSIGNNCQNILLPKFYDSLYYIVYNGPPETIYETYRGPTNSETGIAIAIEKCGDLLYHSIINPSLEVMVAFCKKWEFNIDHIKNPSSELIRRTMIKHASAFSRHKHFFPDLEEVIKINPFTIQYIDDPSDELKMKAVLLNIETFGHLKSQTKECCYYVAEQLYLNMNSCIKTQTVEDPFAGNDLRRAISFLNILTGLDYSYLTNMTTKIPKVYIKDFKFFDDMIIDFLINIPNFIWNLKDIHTGS